MVMLAPLRNRVGNVVAQLRGHATLHCLGDSHVQMFDRLQIEGYLPNTRLRVFSLPGATATGMPNPNSRTQAGVKFQNYLRQVPAHHHVLICLGEVDCGFVIWHNAQRHALSIDDQLQRAIVNYQALVDPLRRRHEGRIILCAAPLPTIMDGRDWGEVANLRREVTATLAQRTQLTQRFNQRLSDYAQQHHLRYLDLDRDLFDPSQERIADRFLNSDPLDHHLNEEALVPVLAQWLHRFDFK